MLYQKLLPDQGNGSFIELSSIVCELQFYGIHITAYRAWFAINGSIPTVCGIIGRHVFLSEDLLAISVIDGEITDLENILPTYNIKNVIKSIPVWREGVWYT